MRFPKYSVYIDNKLIQITNNNGHHYTYSIGGSVIGINWQRQMLCNKRWFLRNDIFDNII